jgi:hypothetical protein
LRLYRKLALLLIFTALALASSLVGFSTHVEDVEAEIAGYQFQIDKAEEYKAYALSRGIDESHISITRAEEVIESTQTRLDKAIEDLADAAELDAKEAEEEKARQEAEMDAQIIYLGNKLLSDEISDEELLELESLIAERLHVSDDLEEAEDTDSEQENESYFETIKSLLESIEDKIDSLLNQSNTLDESAEAAESAESGESAESEMLDNNSEGTDNINTEDCKDDIKYAESQD